MANFHLLRPMALLVLIPLCILVARNSYRRAGKRNWEGVCDPHLLPHLLIHRARNQRINALLWLFTASSLLIIGLSGPSWFKLPVPSFAQVKPHVLLLDMSQSMGEADVSPTRLERAKFIIQDILARPDAGQFALIAYTAEPFVVSPVTEDGNTITSLLSSLNLNIMPVNGHKLLPALEEAKKLLAQSGYAQGELLVISANLPNSKAIDQAGALAAQGISTSVLPMRAEGIDASAWRQLASQGEGLLLDYNQAESDIQQWLSLGKHKRHFDQKVLEDIPLWRDEGRWFILAGALLLLIVFRRGWLQRIEA